MKEKGKKSRKKKEETDEEEKEEEEEYVGIRRSGTRKGSMWMWMWTTKRKRRRKMAELMKIIRKVGLGCAWVQSSIA